MEGTILSLNLWGLNMEWLIFFALCSRIGGANLGQFDYVRVSLTNVFFFARQNGRFKIFSIFHDFWGQNGDFGAKNGEKIS